MEGRDDASLAVHSVPFVALSPFLSKDVANAVEHPRQGYHTETESRSEHHYDAQSGTQLMVNCSREPLVILWESI